MRWVLHLDMDAFYASVEQLTRPTLRDRPVLVGGLGPRGVVAAASYESRRYGVRSAMSMAQARRMCPAAVVLPPRFGLYHVCSERVFEVLRAASPVVEPLSLDEAFIQPTALAGCGPDEVERACVQLRADVRDAVGLPCSVGAGSGKQVAKIASELAKPDGYRVVPHGGERELFGPLSVRSLWGVGPVAEARLRRVGVLTIGQLAAQDVRDTVELLGEAVGGMLHRLANGVDERPVAPRNDVRSISAESTFDLDVSDMATMDAAVTTMATSAHRRLVGAERAARTVTVKVRGADFSLITRSESLPAGTTDLPTLVGIARRLIRAALPPTAVRLIGVAYSGLDGQAQEALFGLEESGADVIEAPATSVAASVAAEVPTAEVPAGASAGVPAAAASAAVAAGASLAGASGGNPPFALTPATVANLAAAGLTPTGGAAAPAGGAAGWRPGDDVEHAEHGHGWVQGAGIGRVTVRFETRWTGPGRAITFAVDDPALTRADPVRSLDP